MVAQSRAKSAVATKRRATRNNNCSSVATVNYPEPPPWRSRGSGYDWQTNERQRNAKPPVVKFAGIKAE